MSDETEVTTGGLDLSPRPPAAAPVVRDRFSLKPVYGLDVTPEEAQADEYLAIGLRAQQVRQIAETEAHRLRDIHDDRQYGDEPGVGERRTEVLTARTIPVMGSANAVVAQIRTAAQKLADEGTYTPPVAPLVFTPERQALASAMRAMTRKERNDKVRHSAEARELVLALDRDITGAEDETLMLARETSVPPEVRRKNDEKRRRRVRVLYAADLAMLDVLNVMRAVSDPVQVAAAGGEKRRSMMDDAAKSAFIRSHGIEEFTRLPR